MYELIYDQAMITAGAMYALVIAVWVLHTRTIVESSVRRLLMMTLCLCPFLMTQASLALKVWPESSGGYFGFDRLFALAGAFYGFGLPFALLWIGKAEIRANRFAAMTAQSSAANHPPMDAAG